MMTVSNIDVAEIRKKIDAIKQGDLEFQSQEELAELFQVLARYQSVLQQETGTRMMAGSA